VPRTAASIPERVALADLVVLGKVTKIEDELVRGWPVPRIPGVENMVSYRIVAVTVESALVGPKNQTQFRVGYVPPGPGVKPRGLILEQLALNFEGCFFLRKHPQEPFFIAQDASAVLDKAQAKTFEKNLVQVKRCARLLGDLDAGLRAKEMDDRLLAAALALFRYRTPLVVYVGKPRTEAIDAEQSRLILAALAEADWKDVNNPSPTAPFRLFLRLGLTAEDGWKPPNNLRAVGDAARQWLLDYGSTYRIRRYAAPDE
jgi:hypothetical protein